VARATGAAIKKAADRKRSEAQTGRPKAAAQLGRDVAESSEARRSRQAAKVSEDDDVCLPVAPNLFLGWMTESRYFGGVGRRRSLAETKLEPTR
jgi:hypothetical protein